MLRTLFDRLLAVMEQASLAVEAAHSPAPVSTAPVTFPRNLGLAALEIAKKELGRGEAGKNNAGPDVVRYRRGIDDEGAWCAAFVSYCLEEGAKASGNTLPFRRSLGAKRLAALVLAAGGKRLSGPEVGALCLWHRGVRGAATGHIGIVSKVAPDGAWCAIEGNKGSFPSKVREYNHEQGEPLFLYFVRLPAGA